MFLFSLFSTLSPLFAKGQYDDAFRAIDRLIEEKNYDKAINDLLKIVREDSAMFDKVQSRLKIIVRSSNRYAEIATQLLDTIEHDRGNTEKIFELSQALDSLGQARTEEARRFIQEVQEVARYSVFRNQLENILAEGRLLIDAGKYADAYNLYLSGFDLYRTIFTGSDYPAGVKTSMNTTQETINTAGTSFTRFSRSLVPAADEMNALLASGSTPREQLLAVTRTVNRVRADLNDLIQTNNLLWNVHDDYQRFGLIENHSEGRYHITFGNLLVNGRPDQDVREGLLGAAYGLWQSVMIPLETLGTQGANGALRDVFEALSAHNYGEAHRLIGEINAALRGPLDMLDMYTRFGIREAPGEYAVFGRTATAANEDYFALIESLTRVLTLISQATDYAESKENANNAMLASTTLTDYQAGRINVAQATQREIGIRRSLIEAEAGIRNLISVFEQHLNVLLPYSTRYKGASQGSAFFRDGLSFTRTVGTDLLALKIASASRQYTVENEDFAASYPARTLQFTTGLSLINGVPKTLDSGEPYLSKDPLQASFDFDALNSALTADIAGGYALLNRYDRDDTDIISTPELTRLRADAANQLARYEALYSQGGALASDARRAVAEAEALRTAGARLYRDSVAALNQGGFDEADENLAGSNTQYGASFAIQDSEVLRREIRERSLALSAEIMRQRREFVDREVAGLLSRAQPEFYADNYGIAEQLLVRAETFYATLKEGENPNIRYWLTIVRNALTFRSGRTIPVTAPLYPEMSQLLSTAGLEYAEGMSLLNNRREEALAYFASARQKTQEVKLLFPLNQEASLLQLRMDQVVDPVTFNANFQERLNTAISGIKNAEVQAFADLQDLAMINPNYRGMPQILRQAEIDMGMRPPGPDETAIARSRDLTRSAQNLIAGGARSNLEVAQQQLTEALRLNPGNTTAQTELDRVERLMGRRAASELEAAVDNEYQEALRELLAGNKLIAYSIVRRVLARPEYRNSGRFQELLQRIESVL